MARLDPAPLEEFSMWTMLQRGVQKADIENLKLLVNQWITMVTQKNAGQAQYSQKGIPWDPDSKAVSFENLERVKMGILCEAVSLILSGELDFAIKWNSTNESKPNHDLPVIFAVEEKKTGRKFTTYDSWVDGKWDTMERKSGHVSYEVTRWAEFPEYPKEE